MKENITKTIDELRLRIETEEYIYEEWILHG